MKGFQFLNFIYEEKTYTISVLYFHTNTYSIQCLIGCLKIDITDIMFVLDPNLGLRIEKHQKQLELLQNNELSLRQWIKQYSVIGANARD